MATIQSVFIPTSPTAATLFTGTIATGATASVTIGYRTIFAIATTGDCNVRFGNATKVPTAAATDWPVFNKAIAEFETGEEFDRISIFNNTAGNVTYWVYCLSRN